MATENFPIYRNHLESHIALESFKTTFCFKKYVGDTFTPDFLIENKLPKEIITCNTCLTILQLTLTTGERLGYNVNYLEEWFK